MMEENRPDPTEILKYISSYDHANKEAGNRVENIQLIDRVRKFIGEHAPPYHCFAPFHYLSRHVVTPNMETLHFVRSAIEQHGVSAVIGVDNNDKFVSINQLKKGLALLRIVDPLSGNNVEKIRIVDTSKFEGMRLSLVETLWGESLIDFHRSLFDMALSRLEDFDPFISRRVHVVDETTWLDNIRSMNITERYSLLLAPSIMGGIMHEDYDIESSRERQFIANTIIPAINSSIKRFNCQPIIVNLLPNSSALSGSDWLGYEPWVSDVVRERLKE